MKKKIYTFALVGIIGLSSVGAPIVAGAEEISTENNTEVMTTLEDVDFGSNDVLDNVVREKRERGSCIDLVKAGLKVDSCNGKKVPHRNLSSSEKSCLAGLLGGGLGLLGGPITWGVALKSFGIAALGCL